MGVQIYYIVSFPQALCNYFAEKMRKPAHIALFASWYPTDPEALNGNFCRAFALLLAEKYRVSVVHVEMDPRASQTEIITRAEGNMQVYLARVPRRSGIFFAPLNQWRWLQAWLNLYKKAVQDSGEPAWIHAEVIWKAGLAAWWIGRQHRIPFVIREHWTGYYPADPQLHGWKAMLHRFVLRRAKAVAGVSQPLAATLETWGAPNSAGVVQNAVHVPETFADAGKVPHSFVHVTNFREEQKQTRKVIETFLQFRDKHPDALFYIVGRGGETEAAHWPQNVGLHFTGVISRDDLSQLYTKASALIAYSRFETFAMSVAEALVCGTPVIYTACGGPESYVKSGMGLCVDADNPATLLAAMQSISESEPDRKAIAAEARIMFDPQHLLETYAHWTQDL